ncbi:TPA: hypothetical protein OUE92_001750 [Serratia marcescens]|nr:hypothetical protein [Serratia marcescens]
MRSFGYRTIIAMILFCFGTPVSWGAIYSYIKSATVINGKVNYDWGISAVDFTDSTRNPCYGLSNCAIYISHRHDAMGTPGAAYTGWKNVPYNSCIAWSPTVGGALSCLRDHPSNVAGTDGGGVSGIYLSPPLRGTTYHVGNVVTQECVGLFFSVTGTVGYSGALLPGSVCGIAPPPVGSCGMAESIELDHSKLSEPEISGNTVAQQFFIDCNMPMNAKLYVSGASNGYVNLGDGVIKSLIKINGKVLSDAGVPVNLRKGANSVGISSTLSINGLVRAGNYSGQSVIILALP